MKFYGNGSVWDKDKDKQLCRFENGHLETKDKYISDRLIELGYKCESTVDFEIDNAKEQIVDEDEQEVVKTNFTSMSIRALKDYCKVQEWTGYTNLSKADLLAFIKQNGGI